MSFLTKKTRKNAHPDISGHQDSSEGQGGREAHPKAQQSKFGAKECEQEADWEANDVV